MNIYSWLWYTNAKNRLNANSKVHVSIEIGEEKLWERNKDVKWLNKKRGEGIQDKKEED